MSSLRKISLHKDIQLEKEAVNTLQKVVEKFIEKPKRPPFHTSSLIVYWTVYAWYVIVLFAHGLWNARCNFISNMLFPSSSIYVSVLTAK